LFTITDPVNGPCIIIAYKQRAIRKKLYIYRPSAYIPYIFQPAFRKYFRILYFSIFTGFYYHYSVTQWGGSVPASVLCYKDRIAIVCRELITGIKPHP